MHTIIKIAVVSILAMFAIVGVVSSSKAEGTSVFFKNGKIALRVPIHSGYKNHFTYGEGQKDYNFSLLTDGSEARMGSKYQRFELRDGDCFPMDGWNDCENDRERFEFSSRPRQKPVGQKCYFYSLKITPNFFDVHPTNTDLGQVHQIGGPEGKAGGLKSFPPLIQIGAKKGKLVFKWHKLSGDPKNVRDKTVERTFAKLKELKSKWTDVSFCLDFENHKMIGWLNGEKKFQIDENPIFFEPKEIYFKYGIYRSFLSKYKKRRKTDEMPTQVVFYDEIRTGNTIEEVDINFNPALLPID